MHRLTAAAALAVASVLALPASASAATEGATIDKTGWWNRANTPTPTPAGPIAAPRPPGVPEGDLTVGRFGAETTAVAAVGIQPEEGPGATVESFTLTLREDPDAQANQGTEEAAVVACPIVSFWAGGENGAWDTRPDSDCEAAKVAGQRDDEGTWTFDLAPIGELWFDTFGTVRADGVALLPDPDAEASFQVVWLGGDDIDVRLEATPGEPADDPFATPATPADPPSDAGLSSGPSGGGSSLFSPPRVSSPPSVAPTPPVEVDVADDRTDADVDTDDDEVAAPVATNRTPTSRAGDLVGNWPAAGFLLVPLLLAVLLATSYWLGPAGQPVTADRRGGVSRALAVRTRTPQEP